MDLTFLGSGSAFTIGEGNYQSNMILENYDQERLLIDCGSDIRLSLHELGLSHKDITDIYVSHTHADHAGGLEYIALARHFDPTCDKPNLFIHESMIDELWNGTLRGGLQTLQGEIATLETFFNIHPIKNNKGFILGNISFDVVQTIHVVNGFVFMPSFGLIFKGATQRIFITTDTQFCPHQIMDFYKNSDIIFQDCETTPFKSGVHAHYNDLKTLSPDIKKKMWLYHCQPGKKPDAENDGFAGFVKKHSTFQIF